MKGALNLYISILCLVQSLSAYTIPDPKIKVYRKGFEVSIPDKPQKDIDTFVFSANLNSKIQNHAFGRFTNITSKPDNNGYWTYKNSDAELKLNDTLYYWITLTRKGKIYKEAKGKYKVKYYALPEIPNKSGLKNPEYQIPIPNIEVYHKGFSVSIPDEEGIRAFNFFGQINPARKSVFDTIFEPDENGRWTYTNNDVELKVGDVLQYSMSVTKNGRISRKDNIAYTVENYTTRTNEPELPETPHYKVPDLTFEIYSKGFEVSIPDDKGIDSFIFNGNRNKEIKYYDFGEFSQRVWNADRNGRWTYKNTNAELKLNDTIYYWYIVSVNEVMYGKNKQMESFKVTAIKQPATTGHPSVNRRIGH